MSAPTPRQRRPARGPGPVEPGSGHGGHPGREPILAKLTQAPGNGAAIGGLKVITENGWFAARPSGTEDVYKIYAESFKGQAHLDALRGEAREMVAAAFKAAGV